MILHKEKMPIRVIAKKAKMAHSTVVATVKRMIDQLNFKSRHRCGRPRVATKRVDIAIVKTAKFSHKASSSVIRSRLPDSQDKNPSNRTIRRRLFDVGLRSYRSARKPKLSLKNIKDRMTFCHKYKLWTSDQWERVMFSDERTLTQSYSLCRHVRRPAKQRYNPKYVIPTVKQAPKVMVWGAVAGVGMAGVWITPKTQQFMDRFT